MIVEVEPNPNCDMSVFARFKAAGPARPVRQVRLHDRNPAGEWYRVTGWSDDEGTPPCQAYVQPVEDSGSGLAHIVYGGLYALRLKPAEPDECWSLDNARQWGEAYLLLASERDLRYEDV